MVDFPWRFVSYLPGKMRIFHGYVSLQEDNPPVGFGTSVTSCSHTQSRFFVQVANQTPWIQSST